MWALDGQPLSGTCTSCAFAATCQVGRCQEWSPRLPTQAYLISKCESSQPLLAPAHVVAAHDPQQHHPADWPPTASA